MGAWCAVVAGCSSSGHAASSPPPLHLAPQQWHTISGPTLRARDSSVVVATPNRVVVLGGFARSENPEHALRDGAIYDPATDTWKGIAPAPFSPFGAVWVGDRLFVAGSDCRSSQSEDEGAGKGEIPCPVSPLRAATYDPDADKWTELHSPDLGYGIGGGSSYGDVYAIGETAVMRLRPGYDNKRYESWSKGDGWNAIDTPPGDDFEVCQANDAVVSLSHGGRVGFTALDVDLKWSKLATSATTYRNDPPLSCAGDAAITWEPFGNARHAYAYDIASGSITSLPQRRGGFPNGPVSVGLKHSALMWDLDGDVTATLEYNAVSRGWIAGKRAPATRVHRNTGNYWLAADVGVSPDGQTIVARRRGGGDVPDTWWAMTLR